VKALGYDPGSKKPGWCALEAVTGARVVLLGCGILDRRGPKGEDQRVEEALDHFPRFQPDLIGVETVDHVFGRKGFGPHMAGHLLRAGRQGARIYQAAIDHGYDAHEVAAEAWRRWLVGSPQADNPAILATVRVRVRGWPADATNHEADAAGVALFVLSRAMLRARGVPT